MFIEEGEHKMSKMKIVCLDMEGVLFPEIWIAFSNQTGIKEFLIHCVQRGCSFEEIAAESN